MGRYCTYNYHVPASGCAPWVNEPFAFVQASLNVDAAANLAVVAIDAVDVAEVNDAVDVADAAGAVDAPDASDVADVADP